MNYLRTFKTRSEIRKELEEEIESACVCASARMSGSKLGASLGRETPQTAIKGAGSERRGGRTKTPGFL